MMAHCTAHAQLKSVYRVSIGSHAGPPISMSKVRGPGVEAIPRHVDSLTISGQISFLAMS